MDPPESEASVDTRPEPTGSPESEATSAVADSCPESPSPASKARSQRRPAAGDALRTRSFFRAAATTR
eukprot:1612835-Lingulodinium_polyedra.AAC.1